MMILKRQNDDAEEERYDEIRVKNEDNTAWNDETNDECRW